MGTACGNGQPRRPPVAESIWSDKNCYDRLMLHRAKCWRYNIATCTCTIDAEAIDEISWSVQYLVPRRALRLSVTEFLRDSANSLVVNSISRPLRSLSLSLSLFPLFLSRVVSLLSSGGWFDALINDRVDNVGHGVPPIGYRVEWRDIQTFFSPNSCHWFWKLDDFIHFRDQNFEWRADLKFKSTRSDRDHYRNFAVCNAFLRGLTYFLASGTEDGYRRFLGIRYWTFRRFRETEGGEKATRAFGKILRNSLLRIWRKSVASFAPSICAPNTRASRL